MHLSTVLWAWICAPATHFLGAQILIVILYSSCGLNKRPAATLAFLLSVSVLSSQYLFQQGPIWMEIGQSHMQLPYLCRDREMTAQNVIIDLSTRAEKSSTGRLVFGMSYKLLRCLNNTSRGGLFINNLNNQLWNLLIEFPLGLGKITIQNLWLCSPVGNVCI